MSSRIVQRWGWTVALLVVAGCGPGLPEVAKVSGRVTCDGKPVTTGTIQFWPDQGRSARGTIQPDGTYSLTTFTDQDGAVLGKHTVTIEATKVEAAMPALKSTDEEIAYFSKRDAPTIAAPKIERLVPEKYSRRETTDLTAEVGPGPNEINFNLQSGTGGTSP